MADESTPSVPFLLGILLLASLFLTRYRRVDPLLDIIPTIGYSGAILSYISAFQYSFIDGQSIVKRGYKQSKPGLFKIPTLRRWMVLVTSPELVEDIKKAPEDILSAREPGRERMEGDYTFPMLDSGNMYQNHLIRSKLTRNIAITFDQVQDELVQSLAEYIPVVGDEWVKVSIMPTMQQVVCRASGRIFVGTPLCWNPDYQKLSVNFATNVVKSAYRLSMFPKLLKPVAARYFCNFPSQVRQMMAFIEPTVKERFRKMEELGDTWEDAPNDMLMWLMKEAKGVERSLEGLARRLLLVNFVSIETTSLSSTQVLYRLLMNPEYIEPLRQEIEGAVAEEGWTKAGIDKMHKLDSFLRETQRLHTLGIVALTRLVLRPFTFSNGVTIPAGTLVATPSSAIHMDEEIYPKPEQFDGFRFSKSCEMDGGVTTTGRSAVSTSPDHLTFGFGRHACPGRFFAVNEIKVLVARILMTYDIKLEEGCCVPHDRHMGTFRVVKTTDVLFRRHQI